MKTQTLIIGVFLGLLLGCEAANHNSLNQDTKPLPGQPKATDTSVKLEVSIGEAAKLTAEQVKQAVSLDKNNSRGMEFKIAVPTYVPAGFEVAKFEAGENQYGPMYGIVYRDSNNSCFQISADSGGWGGEPTDYKTVEVFTPALGNVVLEYTDFDQYRNTGSVGFRDAPITKGEPGKERGYFFNSPAVSLESSCKVISIQESVKVVESLQYLNP